MSILHCNASVVHNIAVVRTTREEEREEEKGRGEGKGEEREEGSGEK